MKVILSESVLNDARQRRGNTDAQAWDDADFVAGVVAECARQPGEPRNTTVTDPETGELRQKPSRSDVLCELAKAMGVSRATTSDLCQLAETYEPGIREEFSSTLTIGHYREAMRCQTVPALKILEQAVQSDDEWVGQPIPVDALRAIVRKYNAAVEPAKGPKELYRMYLDRMCKTIEEALRYAPKADQKSLTSMREWLSKVTA